MFAHHTSYRRSAPAALILIGVVACGAPDAQPLAVDLAEATTAHARHANGPHGPEVSRWLAGLRQATAQFQTFDETTPWDTPLTDCMELPGTGGMGFHYGNLDLIDGVPEEFAPELLVYEPQKNGRMRLVAVEYIVPFDLWPEVGPPPSLHGIDFHRNEAFGLWVLHAWVWKHNPAGMFADWNPNVSCAFAP
jgi:hypothetical protein